MNTTNSILANGAWVKFILPYLIFFFSPIDQLIAGLGAFVFFDFITGIAAARKRGERISSSGLFRTITKIILYMIAIVLSRIFELYFISWLPVTSVTAGYIAITELKSNYENIGEYTGTNLNGVIEILKSHFHHKEK